ncbi:MAG: hypothetical protein ACTHK6_02140 [Solirubrobacterales bacterium]
MDVLIQIPIIDLRGFLAKPSGKFAKPSWPVGTIAESPGHSQFLRGFSCLKSTHTSETGSWQGRAQHVDARNAFRFGADFDEAIRNRLVAAGLPVDLRSSEFFATCLGRSFYGSQTSPRNFLQIRIALNHPNVYVPAHWDGVIEALLDLPVRVSGRGEAPLAEAGRTLARCVREATTKTRFKERVPTWAVTSGRILLVLEATGRAPVELPDRGPDLELESKDSSLWLVEDASENADAWIVARWSGRKRRGRRSSPTALHLSRLHSERVTLTRLAEALVSHKRQLAVNESEPGWELLQSTLAEVSDYLKQEFAFGNNQRAMLDILESDLVLHAAEWEALVRTLRLMPPEVAEKVIQVFNIILGDNVEGDKFENVTGSTIINRSTVQNSFSSLDEASMEDVRAELEALVRKVEELEDPKAAEVAEAFVEESGGARRETVLTGLWSKLKELAPVVSSFATAGTAIGKVLLGL